MKTSWVTLLIATQILKWYTYSVTTNPTQIRLQPPPPVISPPHSQLTSYAQIKNLH